MIVPCTQGLGSLFYALVIQRHAVIQNIFAACLAVCAHVCTGFHIHAQGAELAFSYQGGACEEVGPAELDAVEGDTMPLEFPVISLSEVCTMQIVEHEVEQTIEANEAIRRIEVILSAPDGTVMGSGATEIGK